MLDGGGKVASEGGILGPPYHSSHRNHSCFSYERELTPRMTCQRLHMSVNGKLC